MIHEHENNIANACDCYFISAEILKKDVNKWIQTYELSCKLDLFKRQLYCLTHIIRLQSDEPSSYEKRARLFIQNEQTAKAAMDLLQYCKLTRDITVNISEVYSLCHKAGKDSELLQYLESQKTAIMNHLSKNPCHFQTRFTIQSNRWKSSNLVKP